MKHLIQRGKAFYYLKRIPEELRKYCGYKGAMRLSLRTKDRKQAKKLVKQLDVELDKLWVAERMRVPESLILSFLGESPLFAKANSQATTDRRFSACIEEFLREKQATIRPDGIEMFKSVFREFEGLLRNRDVNGYTHADMVQFREHIIGKGIKPTTVNRKLRYLSVLFNWLVTHGIIRMNPCKGLFLPKQQPDHALRKVFSDDDLEKWFAGPMFQLDTVKDSLPQHFWVPLIALFSGLRQNEICQMWVADVKTVDGIPIFDVNKDDGKQTKTLSSIRQVPVHPRLLEIGFMDYARKRQAIGEQRLFPVKLLKNDRADFGFWVRNYVRKHVTKDPQKNFHGFRHTFLNAGKQAGVPEPILAQMAGHTNESITSNRYGKPYSTAILRDAIEKIDFKIDVERLREVALFFL